MSIADDRRSIGNELRLCKFGRRIRFAMDGITAERLAELIDPVCFVRRTIPQEADGRTVELLSCGHSIAFDTGAQPSFCPICGARIIGISIIDEEGDGDDE